MEKKDGMRIIRNLFVSLVPVQALAVGLPAINTLLSSILVGKFLGENALAAIGFAGPLLLCISAAARTFAGGAQVIASKAIGRGDRDGLACVFNTAMGLCVLFGVLTTALCCSLSGELAVLQGAVAENTATTAAFVRGVGIGMGFSTLSACVFIFLQIERMDRVSGVLSVVMMAVNVLGNVVNIFWLGWGLWGVGLFLSLSNLVAVVIGLPLLLMKGKIFRISLHAFRWSEAWEIIRLGSPNAVISLVCVVRNRVMNHYVFMLGGNVAMAALAAADNLTTAVGCVISAGYTGSCEIISGMLIGQRDVESLRNLPKTMAKSVGWVFMAAYALIFLLAEPFARLLGAEPEHLAVYRMIIRVYNLWYFTHIFAAPSREIYEVMGKVGFVSLVNVLLGAGFNGAITILLAKQAGLWLPVSAPWMSEVIQIALFLVIMGVKMHRPPRSIFEQNYIPNTFAVPGEDRFERTIATPEDAVRASQDAAAFCQAKQLDKRTAYYCGLCIEEMAMDTIKHRFTKQKSTIDLRMIYENGHIRILLRDDCAYFNPNEWLALCKPEDASRSIGIRMVSGLAGKMEYVNSLGLNVLTIEL